MNQNKPEMKTFDNCPNCGSTDRFVAGQARKAGLDNPEMYGLNCRPAMRPDGSMIPKITGLPIFMGPLIDDRTMAMSLVGHKFPVFAAPVDACRNCGMIYTFQQQVNEGQKLQDIHSHGGPKPGQPGYAGPLFPGPY